MGAKGRRQGQGGAGEGRDRGERRGLEVIAAEGGGAGPGGSAARARWARRACPGRGSCTGATTRRRAPPRTSGSAAGARAIRRIASAERPPAPAPRPRVHEASSMSMKLRVGSRVCRRMLMAQAEGSVTRRRPMPGMASMPPWPGYRFGVTRRSRPMNDDERKQLRERYRWEIVRPTRCE